MTTTWRDTIEPEEDNELRICVECGQRWVLTEKNRDWFIEKRLVLPRRCEMCRSVRRRAATAQRREAAG
jgi:hypothetical protein